MKLSKGILAAVVAASLFSLNYSIKPDLESVPAYTAGNISSSISEAVMENSKDSSVNISQPAQGTTNQKDIKQEQASLSASAKTETNSKAAAASSSKTVAAAPKAQTKPTQPESSSTTKPTTKQPKLTEKSSTPTPAPKTSPTPVESKPKTAPAPAPAEPTPAPPSKSSSSKLILGYATYYSSADTSSYNALTSHSSLIDSVATHTYITDSKGNLYIQGPFPQSQVSYANSKGIDTLAVVRNEFSPSVASSVLNNETYKANLINSIVSSVKKNGFKGVNIDFEILKSSDRNAYTAFMKELYDILHPQGYLVTIALPAKTVDNPKHSWSYAYDYVQLGKYADQVILMTYDEHYPGGTPGPIASIGWVQQIVNYASSVIPKSKLLLGIAAYGYDWRTTDNKLVSYSISKAISTAEKYGAEIQWDSKAQVPYYNYTDEDGIKHSVYFENSTSIGYKLNIVNNSNLKGIAIWRLGLEDESYWTTIKSKLN